jgi:DNA (cytosine-5)-methyltransferase 1
MIKMNYKFVSLFSGAMGLDLGLERAGFESIAAVECNKFAQQTIGLNRPRLHIFDDVTQVFATDFKNLPEYPKNGLDLLAGGPPCQSFSIFGNREGLLDKRGQLVYEYLRLVSELKPHVFIMENVRGLLSMPIIPKSKLPKEASKEQKELSEHGSLLHLLLKDFEELGYRVDCFVVNSVNYGAPQVRERVICVGNRHNLIAEFPNPFYSNRPEDKLPPFKTLGDVIGEGFIDPIPEVMDFSARKLHYLSMIPAGGNWRSLPIEIQKESMGKTWYLKGGRSAYWRKLSFAFPSPTVVTMPNHAGTSMCHPTELRAISVGEAAAIQEFPKDWILCGNTAEKFKQIGNAVPIRLGEIAGKVAMQLLDQINKQTGNQTSDQAESELNPITPSKIVHIRPHVRTRTFWKGGKSFSGDVDYYPFDEEDMENEGSERDSILQNQPSLFEFAL